MADATPGATDMASSVEAAHTAHQAEQEALTERQTQQRVEQLSAVHCKLDERRQKRGEAPSPLSPTASAASGASEQAAEVFSTAVQEAEVEWVRVSPEEEPFKWKYVARARLLAAQTELRQMLTTAEDPEVSAAAPTGAFAPLQCTFPHIQTLWDLIARLERRVGVNYVQTEENAGECRFMRNAIKPPRKRHLHSQLAPYPSPGH